MNRTTLIATIAMTFSFSSYAQQPFEKYGYEAKVVTLSHGKYEEFFDQDTLVQIGSVIMNRLNGKILSFVEYDTMYSEATLEPEIISRWLNPDPHAENYYDHSPYHYAYNNPVLFVDPDGRDNVVYLVNLDLDEKTVNSIISSANQMFKDAGLKTQVQLYTGEGNFDPSNMDATDAVAVVGSDAEGVTNYISENISSDFAENELSGADGFSNDESVIERSSKKRDYGLGIIAIDKSRTDEASNNLNNTSGNQLAGYSIVHGAGHNADFGDQGKDSFLGTGIMSSGSVLQNYLNSDSKNTIQSFIKKQSKLNKMYSKYMRQSKYFGDNEPSANYYEKAKSKQ